MSQSPVTGSRRGYAAIIINEKSVESVDSSKFRERTGADKDEDNINGAFCEKLKFVWLSQATSKDVRRFNFLHDKPPENPKTCDCFSCKIQATDHTQSECFLLVISSHGREVKQKQFIRFSDGKKIEVAKLIDMLSDENCPTLQGKPRILILQACRHSNNGKSSEDPGVDVYETGDKPIDEKMATMNMKDNNTNAADVDGADPFGQSEKNINNTNSSLTQDPGINETAFEQPEGTDHHSERNLSNLPHANISSDVKAEIPDADEEITSGEESDTEIEDADYVYSKGRDIPEQFLIVYPTVAGKKAKRNKRTGSWLIHELCDEIKAHDYSKNPEMNFLKILTRTTARVAKRATINKDETKRGKKNAVCIIHRLTKPLVFREIEASPETPSDNPAL